jgi:membrane-bound lytic murein transglycosylase D
VDLLLASADEHFAKGRHELAQGHLRQARIEFDLALQILMESPRGGRTEPRIREHFDRLVDRISAYEMSALAEGDGFAEQRTEPASIDEILAISTFEPPAALDLTETVRADLDQTEHDVDIPLNERVLRYVGLFQTRLRDFILDGLRRGSQYLPMIQNVFRAEGLPLDLAYIPLIESAFKPTALSRASAKGVWQFMRGTALENGLRHDWYIDERSDPEKATVAAAKYLRTLHEFFEGDWHLALASYNGGPGRLQRAVRRSGKTDFWSLSATSRYLPRETREYVPMILAAIIVARNPAQYGLSFEPEAPIAYETVTVSQAVDLRRVAEWTGTPIDRIQALNPELRRWTTPVRDAAYQVKVPDGTAAAFMGRLAAASPEELSALRWHTVKKGETLVTIARKLKVSRADLAAANHLSLKARVKPGDELVIPRAPSTLIAARVDRPVPAEDTAASGTLSRLVHRVKAGDTLFSIARLYQTTVASLKTWNRLRTDRINPGDRLTVFAHRPAS